MSEKLLPERLKNAREQMGITMAEASRRLNMSKIGYCRYEYGDRTPSPQALETIARCLNTSVHYLTGITDEITPDYYVISKDSEPELFELITTIKSSDQETIKRLLAYYQNL